MGDQPVRAGHADDGGSDAADARRGRRPPACRGLPRRHRGGGHRHPRPPRWRQVASSPSTRATARHSGWSRCSASTTCRRGWSKTVVSTGRAGSDGRRPGHPGLPRPRPGHRRPRPGHHHRRGHRRAEGDHPRHAQDAGAAQEADRPARAQGRRLRRPRAARRRPVRGDEAARGARRDPRVPRPRVRRLQARPPARPALRAGRRARPGDPLRRRRAAQPRPARWRRLGQAQGPGPQGGAPDRGRADQAVRRPPGHQGPRLRAGHPVADRARGRLPVPRDARPAEHGRGGQGRHASRRTHGPAGLRRRRLRQDRDRRARGVQGGAGRQAGRRAGAHHPPRDPALRDLRRADERLPGHPEAAEPVPDRQGGPRGRRRAPGRARSTS